MDLNNECCECGKKRDRFTAFFEYEGEIYCEDCMLDKLIEDGEIEVTTETYYREKKGDEWSEDYLTVMSSWVPGVKEI